MSDYVLIDGDQAIFMPNFEAAVVVVQPGEITGSGPDTVGGKAVCVEGDEDSVSVSDCVYIAGQYCIPGTGTLSIDSLASDQVAEITNSGGTPALLVGGQFTAKFEVANPAKQPPSGPGSPIPDSTSSYSGQGMFVSTNTKRKGK